jgi:xylulokinase
VFEKTSTILLPHDWLTWRLTGQKVTDRGDASGTGYWSPSEERYRPDLLCTIDDTRDWDSMLPTVLGPTTVAGEWRETGAIVAAGTGDNMAAALGLGLSSRDFALSFGTSCTAFTVREMPSADSTGVVAGFADATGRFLPLACTMNGTKVLETVARLLGVDNRTFDELALAAPPGAGGLILVPYLDGERTPSRPTSTGTFLGLRSDVMPAQVARAAVEGIVCNLLIAAAPLWPSEDGDGRILLAGGGAHSRALQRVVADLTGRLVHVHICDELVARGAALQAAAVLQGREIGDVMRDWALQPDEIVEPDDTVDRSSILGEYREAALSY